MRVLVATVTVLALCGPAVADADWAKGLVTADGVGIADRHAPNPAVARGTSRRAAEEAARKELAGRVAQLPLAAGGVVSAKLGDPAIKAFIDRAVAQAIAVAAQPETDGAWKVTMGVPIEAIRQAIEGGPRAIDDVAGDGDPAVVVVQGVGGPPGVGATVGGFHAATIWVTTIPDWAKDAPRLTVAPTRASAAGAIAVTGTTGSPATLYVLVTR